jgi:hypothetical protein
VALDCKLTIGLRPFDIAVVESQNPEAQHRLPTLINDKTPLAWFTAETNLRAVFRRNQQQNRANKITRRVGSRGTLPRDPSPPTLGPLRGPSPQGKREQVGGSRRGGALLQDQQRTPQAQDAAAG